MEKIIILSNPGSASKKYSVYNHDTEIAWFHFEKQNTSFVCSYKVVNTFEKISVTSLQYISSLEFVLDSLKKGNVIKDNSSIYSISVRTVIPNSIFVYDSLCTLETVKSLEEIVSYDPVHIAPILDELKVINKSILKETPVCFISDSVFHVTAKRKLPIGLESDVYTIGYHGLSCESVLSILKEWEIEHSKLIVCHLGGGSSISAIKNSLSVYNSMDYSPLSGTFMSSRSGSIDPFLILLLMKERNMTYEETLMFLYSQSGLKALSKTSEDLRVVREEAFKGNSDAKDAIIQFVESIASYICKASSFSSGIDTLVFTGTIGFRASYIREMVTEKLKWLGILINHDKNLNDVDTCFEISTHDSKIKVYVVLIDEMKEMHSHTIKLLKIKL